MSKSFTPRLKHLQGIVEDTFQVQANESNEIFQNVKNMELWETWLSGKGHAHIFVYHQPPGRFNPETNDWEPLAGKQNAAKEFFVHDGDIKLCGKGLYFVRMTPPGKPVNTQKTDDSEVMVGEIHENAQNVLNTVVSNIYARFIDKLSPEEWGQCESEVKREFQMSFSKFSDEVKEACKGLQQSLTLESYPKEYSGPANDFLAGKHQTQSASKQKEMIEAFTVQFDKWYEKIESELNKEDEQKKDDKDSGPRVELDHWKQKMRKLTQISEQLKSKNCRTVYDVLNMVSSGGTTDAGKPKEKLYLATSKWRSIELKVTEQLNEAKDNVKYLQTLEKFIEPLYDGTPTSIIETLPALMNSIKMIHTIARYYNTNERMTGLFVKITNMMIHNCKFNILNFRRISLDQPCIGVMGGLSEKDKNRKGAPVDDIILWKEEEYPHEQLIEMLKTCQNLLTAYKANYEKTRDRLKEMPKAKQFDFSEQAIFNKFELFSRRVGKLKELFSTIQQFRELEKHNLEGIQPIVDKFATTVKDFQKKNHKLLDYNNGLFDKDYVEFNVQVSHVEIDLREYINRNFDHITNIEDSLKLLRKFRFILKRPMLRKNCDEKYEVLLKSYTKILDKIETSYTNNNKNPPIVRNLPTVAGCITWSRHLIHRAMVPLQHFPKEYLIDKTTKQQIKQYKTASKISITLYAYELAWRTKWADEVEKAKAGLHATLLVTNPKPEDSRNKLYVNFDSDILTLIREAKCLSRLGADIPNTAKIVLLQEEKFKMYKFELQYIISEYNRIHGKIRPNVEMLLSPHKEDLQHTLRPGFCNLTWTSMNIDGYLSHVHFGLSRIDQLINNINDIMDNRIQNNLESLSKTVLVHLPQEEKTYSLEDFVKMQEEHILTQSETLKSKNFEVEDAVYDLIQTISNYKMTSQIGDVIQEEIQKINRYYNWSMYQALLHATKFSLNQMKERICGRRNAPKQVLRPFFEVDVQLEGSKSILKPSLEDVQSAINRAASHVLKSTKKVQNWNQGHLAEEAREPFYDWIAKDKEIVKVILLLTGSIQGTKNKVTEFLDRFSVYQWLWKERPEDRLKKFKAKDPQLEDFEIQLADFDQQAKEINQIQDSHQIGALSLKTKNVKVNLIKQINNWKEVFQAELHKKAKDQLDMLCDDIKAISTKIDKHVPDVDALGGVMQALEEIRKKQSDFTLQAKPIKDMYALLNDQDADMLDKEEHDKIKKLEADWEKLVAAAEKKRTEIHIDQAKFKKQLIANIGTFIVDVEEFKESFDKNGPNDPKVASKPKEAVDKLKMFTEEYNIRDRKFESYHDGETLFGLPHQEYVSLTKVKDEITRLEKLYGLYTKVNQQNDAWKDFAWTSINDQIVAMNDTVEAFQRDCQRLPGALKEKQAFNDLKKTIGDMTEIIPLIQGLSKESIQERHWREIMELPQFDKSYTIPFQEENMTLKNVMDANLLIIKDDVEDICDQADKQLKLEKQLKEITAFWDAREMKISTCAQYEAGPCVISGDIQETQEKLEENIMQLQQMLATRQVKPFLPEVQSKLDQLSSTGDTIEKWLKTQQAWVSLVQVFTTGDISKAMPTESKIFKGVHGRWLKIMERANEQKNVVQCCQNDILKSELPSMGGELDLCQKKLDTYLEGKRSIFPRFYFVAPQDLLKVLSNGSDPTQIQDDFEKMFDAINKVRFDESEKNMILEVIQTQGGDEVMMLNEGVMAEGNVELWLTKLEQEMQKSVKARALAAANDFLSLKLTVTQANEVSEFRHRCKEYQSQFSLLGLQLIWAQKVTEALEVKAKDRKSEFKKKKEDIKRIMTDLTAMCLEDIKNKYERMKVETLVTIHVNQVQTADEIQRLSEQGKIKDINDFQFTRSLRVIKDAEKQEIRIDILDVSLYYQYEFLGVKERLCVTPLTERCYITLSQALGMNFGGAPAGPAGTGKTETVKDLGRSLGIFVVVTNCSPEHNMNDMAKIFKGLCMSGLWGCFDEFNRISLPTLSVVAAQVESMTIAKKKNMKLFSFPGEDKEIKMIKACGYFITMNPGYAGRQNLPENLKVLFRGVTMMVPDRRIIIMVKLAAVGYIDYEMLSLKFNMLYKLSEEQLSAQRHYDFGLRNILSVLRTAGRVKREDDTGATEEFLMARTLKDMNMSKFVFADKKLFVELIEDIFTTLTRKLEEKTYPDVEKEIRIILKDENLDGKKEFFIKLIQLYETFMVRHGFMVVGQAGCGKTTIYNVLTKALSKVKSPGGDAVPFEITRMNPKAITGKQMYGCMNAVGEWEAGIFSEIWKKKNAKSAKTNNWIQADGPVDAIWIENLNTVLDDNRILTLANAERIPMSDTCKMTFEVENLNNASPATVSRCGIIYVSPNELGWEPLIQTWCLDKKGETTPGFSWKWMMTTEKPGPVPDSDPSKKDKDWNNMYNWNWTVRNCKKYFFPDEKKRKERTFQWCEKHLQYMMHTPEVVRITQMLNLLEATAKEFSATDVEALKEPQFEKLFVYAFAWGMAGLCDAKDRQIFHKEVLEFFKAPLPNTASHGNETETIFDYWFNPAKRDWELWSAQEWDIPKKLIFSQLLIPTMDSTRCEYIIKNISNLPDKKSEPRKENGLTSALIVGGPGTAKTSTILMYAMKFDAEKSFKRINFSSATSPGNFQESIDGELEKKNSKTYEPIGHKIMTVFVDDFSMPKVNEWGDQETLEITRQLIDHKGLYFLDREERGNFKTINNLKFVACMNHPGGGMNDVPNRIKRQFFSMNMPDPSNKSVENIYGQILNALTKNKKGQVYDVNESLWPLLIEATIDVWRKTSDKLKKTPSKFHYSFNIRELSRVFQGIIRVVQNGFEYKVIQTASKLKEKPSGALFLVGLWRHECFRTFYDKLTNSDDKNVFNSILEKATRDKFRDFPFKDGGFDEDMLITDHLFADFQRDDILDENGDFVESAPFVYEACPSLEAIRTRCYDKLERYNEINPSKKMNLVLFDDALKHLLRITRIIGTSAGSAMLVGVGGSGKQSLTKLAASIEEQFFFQIQLTRSYGLKDFKEDVHKLYERSVTAKPKVCFILTDAEIKQETFLEAINSMLATGEIPGLLVKEDREMFPTQLKPIWVKEEGKKGEDPSTAFLWHYFLNRVKDNLHTVLCFSPVGAKFRERSQKFPSIFTQVSIDWFLQWPLDALVGVSQKFISDFDIFCKKETKTQLIQHMGQVHNMVTDVCELYFSQFRRRTYVTPKSYLSFIEFYKKLYETKIAGINKDEEQITGGLEKLDEAGKGVEIMKKELNIKDENLRIKSEEVNQLLKVLDVENAKANKKATEVNATRQGCEAMQAKITIEKTQAEIELAAALPFLEKAKQAANSIQPKDIDELRKNQRPAQFTKTCFDMVLILFQKSLKPVIAEPVTIAKKNFTFHQDSYEEYGKLMMTPEFIKNLLTFSKDDKDNINDETIELLEPYLSLNVEGLDIFTPENAKSVHNAMVGLTQWCSAMNMYQKASKIVNPKMRALEQATADLDEANKKLSEAEDQLRTVEALQRKLKGEFEVTIENKNQLAADALATRKRMDAANRLITSLGDNRGRWEKQKAAFLQEKTDLIGNVAKAAAFVCYCGPFNSDFRNKLTIDYFQADLDNRQVPSDKKITLTKFLVSQTQVGEWAMEGLPSDDLSIQNAIMVTKADRWPLMIDPQGQAQKWIVKKDPQLTEQKRLIFTLSIPDLKTALSYPIESGLPCLIKDIENEIDPLLDPVLEKQLIRKGKNFKIVIGGQEYDWDNNFRFYMTSRMANPAFSPELFAKATIIDFTVTQGGLEQQLLGILIGKIEKPLEDQLVELQESVTENKKQLKEGEEMLLDKLATAEGSLLDDPTLIDVLADIKQKSKEVAENLETAELKTIEINEKREKYRPVAGRGSVLYFCVTEMANINWMYNTSLYQFLELFDYGIEHAVKPPRIEDKVENIINCMTYKVYRYMNRIFFEADKITFKMLMALRIQMKKGDINLNDVNLLLKAGAAIMGETPKQNWMDPKAANNIKALSMHRFEGENQPFFKDIFERISRQEKDWRAFIEKQEPENERIPEYDDKIQSNSQLGPFIHLCLIRALREDRTMLASVRFIEKVMADKRYVEPVNDSVNELYLESRPTRPVLYLLQAGADPTQTIDDQNAKMKRPTMNKVSMGEAQEIPAKEKLKEGYLTGKWLLLSNCQLSLELMAEMENLLNPTEEPHPDFRLWITCEYEANFPLGLLQMAIKNSFVPPKGLQAGLSRTFNTQINADFLERVEPLDKWKSVVFAISFMHSIVIERRKFGPLGFTVPYEYNYGDMESSLLFIEKHMNYNFQHQLPQDWAAIQYVTCQIQYGGKITDNMDRIMFDTYGEIWLNEKIFEKEYSFNDKSEYQYRIPLSNEHSAFLKFVEDIPGQDQPSIFGLNASADLTFRLNESLSLISTLIDVQPKEGGGAAGMSREDTIKNQIKTDYLKNLPPNFDWMEVEKQIKSFKPPPGVDMVSSSGDEKKNIPLSVFLRQEIESMQRILDIARTMMEETIKAIDGEVVMTPQIVVAIEQMYNQRVPHPWMYDATGVEISWVTPSLGSWMKGLMARYRQLKNWVDRDRPASFWLTGFIRPQGFLTSVKQEVNRQHSSDKWALDDVDYSTTVQKDEIKSTELGGLGDKTIKAPSQGVFIHGLFLEGAAWNKQGYLEESEARDLKTLYKDFPLMLVSAELTKPDPNARGPAQKGKETRDQLLVTHYECPVYKYKNRTDKYLIFKVLLKPDNANEPNKAAAFPPKTNWKLKGVALLCTTE